MKVAELREKAKEFEIETTGKKKAELVEEIYVTAAKAEGFRDIKGILQIRPDSSGIIHAHGYMKSNDDAFVPAYLIRSARLRTGDVIEARCVLRAAATSAPASPKSRPSTVWTPSRFATVPSSATSPRSIPTSRCAWSTARIPSPVAPSTSCRRLARASAA